MTSATNEQLDAQPDFISLGRFEPPETKRILKRLEEEHIPFRIDAPDEVHPDPYPYRIRPHWVVIYVPPDDVDRAGEIARAEII